MYLILLKKVLFQKIYTNNDLSHCIFNSNSSIFPISQHGSFFGQWGNLFILIDISYDLANNQQ